MVRHRAAAPLVRGLGLVRSPAAQTDALQIVKAAAAAVLAWALADGVLGLVDAFLAP